MALEVIVVENRKYTLQELVSEGLREIRLSIRKGDDYLPIFETKSYLYICKREGMIYTPLEIKRKQKPLY